MSGFKAFTVNIILFGCFIPSVIFCKTLFIPQGNNSSVNIQDHLSVAFDSSASWKIDKELQKENVFSSVKGSILSFKEIFRIYWVKLEISNHAENQYLKLGDPMIYHIDFYLINDKKLLKHVRSGSSLPFSEREVQTDHYLFHLPKGDHTCYIRLKSNFNLQVPVDIASFQYLSQKQYKEGITLALYFGLMLAMLVYNLFLYFSVKDKAYLYYTGYMLFIILAYSSFKGLGFHFLWPSTPYINFLVPTISSSASIFICFFTNSVLKLKIRLPKLYLGANIFICFFLISMVMNFLEYYTLSVLISQTFTLLYAIYIIIVGAISFKGGYKPARFFLLGWASYMLSVVVYILSLNSIIPYNSITNNAILYGSAIEAILLSFALADRINIMRKETTLAREQEAVEREQKQRALEKQLETAQALDQTQTELIKTARMASMGRTVARIAHELNTPIYNARTTAQHITSQTQALLEDIKTQPLDALKNTLKEYRHNIDKMSSGLMTSINRASRLISNFRQTSADQTNIQKRYFKLKSYINTTLVSHEIALNKKRLKVNLTGDNPMVYTDAGLIYQLIQNLLTNTEKYGYPEGDGVIDIDVKVTDSQITVTYKDYGKGISQDILPHIFKPFYTTGEEKGGIGLGLSIIHTVVTQNLQGNIECKSMGGEGVIFVVRLNKEKLS